MANELLLITHVSVRRGSNGLKIDNQTAAGIAQWCKYFNKVSFYGILEQNKRESSSSVCWVDIKEFAGAERCELFALPNSYSVIGMLKNYREVRRIIRKAVSLHQHLCFTIGGLVGDWPSIGAVEAIQQNRRFAAWIDRVEPFVIRNKLTHAKSLLKKCAATVLLPTMEVYTRYLLRQSSVALLQGMDTFIHYSKFAPRPMCTYDTHTKKENEISQREIASKKDWVAASKPLRIVYVGRADPMKGPFDWLKVLSKLKTLDIPFFATWVGDGPSLDLMRQAVQGSSLANYIHLPGFNENHASILNVMAESDLFVFCHKTPESPRSLIEALVCGCPIIGYETAYSKGLVDRHGGGLFVPLNDVDGLAYQIAALHKDRILLSSLIENAALSGEDYNEDTVYEYRAGLMLNA